MGCTYGIGGDAYPYTVTAVWPDKEGKIKKCAVRRDNYRVVEGSEQNGSAKYEYHTQGKLEYDDYTDEILTLRANGYWIPKGEPMRYWGVFWMGKRVAKRDPSF